VYPPGLARISVIPVFVAFLHKELDAPVVRAMAGLGIRL
jgi:hypothetical protein